MLKKITLGSSQGVIGLVAYFSLFSHLSFDRCFCSSMVDLCIHGLIVLLETCNSIKILATVNYFQ